MSSNSRSQKLITPIQFQDTQLSLGERFLSFPLNSRANSLLSLSDLRGTINIQLTEILPVPHIDEFWLGVVNWRGEAIWILDLSSFLGAVHWCHQKTIQQKAMAILIQVKTQTIGLLVQQVHNIESYEREDLLPIIESMVPQQQRKFFQGYFLSSDGEPLMVLDVPNLVAALH